MTLSSVFGAAAGGVSGRDHRRAYRDGQDGFAVVNTPHVTAAIVTDGCSSGRYSEVGARLGAVWLADLVGSRFTEASPVDAARAVTRDLVARLCETARSCSPAGELETGRVGDLLLFGFLAAVVTTDAAIVFGVGDGFAWVDGRAHVIDPGPDNAPAYAAYALLGAPVEPRVLHLSAICDVDVVAVGTDGAAELLRADAEPSLDALVRDERLLVNPSLLRKRLCVLSDRGLFWDDATVGIVRRRT